MKRKIIIFSMLFILLGQMFNFDFSQASEGYLDVYPSLSKSEKEEASQAMFWLYDFYSDFHYKNNYSENSLIFSAMEQSNANYHNKNFEYSWDHNFKNHWEPAMGDPLGAFEAYDKGESSGVDWYLKNFWNISPTYPTYEGGGESVGAYYHKGYYYKYYHNFPIMSKPTIRNLYDLGKDYYAVKYDISHDVDWDDFYGPYYAIVKKKNVEGKEMWSAIYSQGIEDEERTITLEEVITKAFPEENLARPTSSKVLVNGKNVKFEAYNIKDNNYFKLRDIAFILKGTSSNFQVGWDENRNAINLLSGKDYIATGGELKLPRNRKLKESYPSSSKMILNDKEIDLRAYNIDGNNYFKLRDLGNALGFNVDWDQRESTVIINSRLP